MHTSATLDVIESLLNAAAHPDVTAVERYGNASTPGGQSPAGVKITHRSGSEAMLWAAAVPRNAEPVPTPTEPLPMKWRAARLLVLTHQLLDAARPDEFTRWELCRQPGVESPVAAALRVICRDGSVAYLRATAASGPTGEPEHDLYQDYRVPQGVHEWRHSLSVRRAEPVSV